MEEGKQSDFYCRKCKLQFGKKLDFDLHLSLVHGEKVVIKTETKSNLSESELDKEMSEDHRENNSYKCEICHSCFKVRGNLNKHERDFVLQVRCRELDIFKFFEKLLGNFLDLFGKFWEFFRSIFWEEFFGRNVFEDFLREFFWEDILGGIFGEKIWGGGIFFGGYFWENFFGRIFLGGFFGRIFLGGILWEELLSRN